MSKIHRLLLLSARAKALEPLKDQNLATLKNLPNMITILGNILEFAPPLYAKLVNSMLLRLKLNSV